MNRLTYLVIALIIVGLPFVASNDFHLFLGQTLAYTAIAVIGLNLLLGLSGQMSLGQGGFYAVGAYSSAILASNHGWSVPASMLAGVAVATVCGVAIGLVALRTRGLYLAMATLAFGFIVEILAQRSVGITGGTMGLFGVPPLDFGLPQQGQHIFFWFAAGMFLLVQIVSDYIFGSGWSRRLLAVKESESFARTIGLNVPIWRTGIFAFSALLAGLAGALFAHQTGFISSEAFNIRLSIGLLIAAVVGGLTRSYGPIIGAAIFLAISEVTASLHGIGLVVQGAILLFVLLLFPEGAIGLWRLVTGKRGKDPMQESRSTAPFTIETHASADGIALEVKALSKSYAGVKALQDVSFQVRPGVVHALIGPNGAGKSTMINILAGLYQPTSGQVIFNGRDLTALPAHQRAGLGIARTFQNLQLVESLSVLDNIMLGLPRRRSLISDFAAWAFRRDYERAEREEALAALAFLGLEGVTSLRPSDLSYGHRKLCELARALVQKPALMLLDEPIAGINTTEAHAIADVIRKLRDHGVTILLIEHNMEFVMGVSDRVTVLDYGCKIAEGTPREVQSDAKVIAAYLGVEIAS